MAYPQLLKLTLKPGYNYSNVHIANTPSNRMGSKIVKGVDITAAFVGIGTSIALCFVSGGSLIALGVATAVWGTGRSGYQLLDKASHGETINPFTNTESRMMWLGIAANIVSFGAMGASMRLTSLAVRGRNISTSFRVLVNVMNGTSIVVSGIALIDTAVFLIEHYDDISAVDGLMYLTSIAFWTKGLFTYKTAGTLIKNAQNETFKAINKELKPEDAARLSSARQKFNNDTQLLREFYRASKANISLQTFSQILIDANMQGQIQFDGAGNLVLTGGQKYSFEFLGTLPQNVRRHYFNVVTNLKTDQVELLESLRKVVNNDMKLIAGLHKVAVQHQLTPHEATEQVLSFWARYIKINLPIGAEVTITDGSVVLGRAPPLQLPQLRELSAPMLRFVGEHLARVDDATSRQWGASVPALLQLEARGMFSQCRVTQIVPAGRAVLLLNESLQISIYKLQEIESGDCTKILKLIGQLTPDVSTVDLTKEMRLLISTYRLRLECHRRESVSWMVANANSTLRWLGESNLQNYEKDRLFTFKNSVTTAKATPYMARMMSFVADMEPKNVSEMVSYGEYVITCVEAEKRNLDGQMGRGELTLPANTNKAAFLRQKASDSVLGNPRALRQKWEATVALVREHAMVGPAALEPGLGNAALVAAVRGARCGFGSEASAAYHILKHPTDPPSAYVERANKCVRTAGRWQVSLVQDGDARTISLEGPDGSAVLLERGGRVLLATFTPKTS